MHRHTLVSFCFLLGCLMVGCSPRPDAGLTAAAGGAGLLLDLPAITIAYDSSGVPTVSGITPAELEALAPGSSAQLTLPATAIGLAQSAGIQHIQASNTPNGLRLFVNGAALPGLAWDAIRLQNAVNLAAQLGFALPPDLIELLPLLPQLGVGATVRFPLADGATPVPPATIEPAAAEFQAQQRALLAEAGSQPVIRIPVYYRENGSFLVNDVTDAQWQMLTGLPWGALRFNVTTLEDLQRVGVREIVLSANQDGLQLDFDGKPLPYLAWNRGEIRQTIALAEQLGLLGPFATGDAGQSTAVDLLAQWLPMLQATEVAIHVYLPE